MHGGCLPEAGPGEHDSQDGPQENHRLALRQLEGQCFPGRDALWQALEAAFKAIPPADIKTLYGSMHRRMAAVMVNKGGHTKY